jgi:transglutaminase-like putative cysteine protease
MKYHISHKTEYFYGEAVPLCHNVVRLRPRDTHRQTCSYYDLVVQPTPSTWRERTDFYGNHLTWFSLQEPHTFMSVTAVSEVDVISDLTQPTYLDRPWEQVVADVASRRDSVSLDARQFVFDSPYIARANALADYAKISFWPGRPLLQATTELTNRIYKEFKYLPGATSVGTPVLDVLRTRQGVCQDFAHLQIGMLRSIGLPARYVSGYLVTRPPAGKARLVGADASHAWLSVFLSDYGWVDFDPTNGVSPTDQHITVAWARDYEDVGPVKGVIIGGKRHWLRVAVDVVPEDEKLAAAKAAVDVGAEKTVERQMTSAE